MEPTPPTPSLPALQPPPHPTPTPPPEPSTRKPSTPRRSPRLAERTRQLRGLVEDRGRRLQALPNGATRRRHRVEPSRKTAAGESTCPKFVLLVVDVCWQGDSLAFERGRSFCCFCFLFSFFLSGVPGVGFLGLSMACWVCVCAAFFFSRAFHGILGVVAGSSPVFHGRWVILWGCCSTVGASKGCGRFDHVFFKGNLGFGPFKRCPCGLFVFLRATSFGRLRQL